MMRHSFSGRSIMSICLTPNSLSASTAAATMLGVEPSVPASPQPLAPSGLTGVGVTVLGVDRLFDHRLADALSQAAVNLAFDDQRVDQIASIVDGDHAQQLRLT